MKEEGPGGVWGNQGTGMAVAESIGVGRDEKLQLQRLSKMKKEKENQRRTTVWEGRGNDR